MKNPQTKVPSDFVYSISQFKPNQRKNKLYIKIVVENSNLYLWAFLKYCERISKN